MLSRLQSVAPRNFRSVSSLATGRFPTRINSGINFLDNGYEYPIERFGRYVGTKTPGLTFLIPFIDKIHQVDTRELCLRISPERAYTQDNVEVILGGNLFLQFVDSRKAVYGASMPLYAALQFAQGVMRTQVGKRELDQLFESRSEINKAVVEEMKEGASEWGCKINRFEITDLSPSDDAVAKSLHKQATALRDKKEKVLGSEGDKISTENRAIADMFKVKQEADAYRYQQEQKGEGDKALLKAQGEGEAARIESIARSLSCAGGGDVVKMVLSQRYIDAFSQLAQKSTTTLLPSDVGDVAKMVATGANIFNTSNKHQ